MGDSSRPVFAVVLVLLLMSLMSLHLEAAEAPAVAKNDKSKGNKGRRLLQQAGAGEADATDNSISDVVRVKVTQLLAALTSSSASSVMDPATMRQISASAYQLLQMQEDSQLTDRSLQAALSIAADAITSAVLAGKGVDSVYASELLVMRARGLQLSTAADGSSSTGAGRRLLAAPTAYTFKPNGASRGTLLAYLDALADLLDENAGPGIGWVSAPSSDISVSVLKENGGSYGNYVVAVGPETTNNTQGTAVQAADLANPDNAQVNLLAGLVPADASVAVWLQLVQDPAVLVTQVPTPTEHDVETFKAAALNSTLPRVAPPLLNLTVLTPALRVRLPAHSADDALPCAEGQDSSIVDCRMVIKLPISNPAYVDVKRLLLCLRIDDGGLLVAPASEADGWQMYGNYSSDGTLRCVANKQGTYVVAAVDPVDTTRPAVPQQSPVPVNVTVNYTACNGTMEFDSNATACNTTFSATLDGNATLTNTTKTLGNGDHDVLVKGSDVNNTTGTNDTSPALNGTDVNNTTGTNGTLADSGLNGTALNTTRTNDTSPSPSPQPEESPSPSPKVEVFPSPSPAPVDPLQGVQEVVGKLRGGLVNLGAVAACPGTFVPELTADGGGALATDSIGAFEVTTPVLAKYTFTSTSAGKCRDAVTLSDMQFPLTITLPAVESATVTAISLLTAPARFASPSNLAPALLWSDVYSMFGFNDQAQTTSA